MRGEEREGGHREGERPKTERQRERERERRRERKKRRTPTVARIVLRERRKEYSETRIVWLAHLVHLFLSSDFREYRGDDVFGLDEEFG